MKRYVSIAFLLIALGAACSPEDRSVDDTALKERARVLVSNIFAGKYAPVRQYFNPTMESKLSEEGIEEARSAYESIFGSFVSMGEPEIVKRAALRVVNVPLKMSEGEGQA